MISWVLIPVLIGFSQFAVSANAGSVGGQCMTHPDTTVTQLAQFVCPDGRAISEQEFQQALDRSLMPYLKKTDREISFFHYGSRDKYKVLPSKDGSYTGPVDVDEKDADGNEIGKKYLKTVAALALHSDRQNSELGNGIYTATEPLASISYSDTHGFLMKVTMPKGMGYLDIRDDHRSIPISREDATAMYCYVVQQKGNAEGFEGFLSEPPTLDIAKMIKTSATQKFVEKFYDDHDVGFLAAGYGLYDYGECHLDPKQDFMTMAVFQNPKVVDRIKTELFVPNIEKNPSKKKKKAYRELMEYFDAFDCAQVEKLKDRTNDLCDPNDLSYRRFHEYRDAIESVIGKSSLTPAHREKLTSGLFGCNSKYSSEVTSINRRKAK